MTSPTSLSESRSSESLLVATHARIPNIPGNGVEGRFAAATQLARDAQASGKADPTPTRAADGGASKTASDGAQQPSRTLVANDREKAAPDQTGGPGKSSRFAISGEAAVTLFHSSWARRPYTAPPRDMRPDWSSIAEGKVGISADLTPRWKVTASVRGVVKGAREVQPSEYGTVAASVELKRTSDPTTITVRAEYALGYLGPFKRSYAAFHDVSGTFERRMTGGPAAPDRPALTLSATALRRFANLPGEEYVSASVGAKVEAPVSPNVALVATMQGKVNVYTTGPGQGRLDKFGSVMGGVKIKLGKSKTDSVTIGAQLGNQDANLKGRSLEGRSHRERGFFARFEFGSRQKRF
jgi:hypothetical protein